MYIYIYLFIYIWIFFRHAGAGISFDVEELLRIVGSDRDRKDAIADVLQSPRGKPVLALCLSPQVIYKPTCIHVCIYIYVCMYMYMYIYRRAAIAEGQARPRAMPLSTGDILTYTPKYTHGDIYTYMHG